MHVETDRRPEIVDGYAFVRAMYANQIVGIGGKWTKAEHRVREVVPFRTVVSIEPRVRDGTAPAGGAPVPAANTTVKVPHPLPVIRPDRYSSGATPPASDLTPGAANPAVPGQPLPPPAAKPKPKTPASTPEQQESQ